MGKSLVFLFLIAAISQGGAGSGFAGFEDGAAAYNRGDYATAFKEYRQLAEQGDARAQLNLGLMYQTGKGVPKNDREALKWYFKATETINKNPVIQPRQNSPHP
jgi:TPR repeat protein